MRIFAICRLVFIRAISIMHIGGLQKFSLLDYPGLLSAIVFTQGCNFRCPFCYNPELVARNNVSADKKIKDHSYSEDDFFVFLKSRIKKLDAIVISGGEPTIQKDIVEFIRKIKEMGFKIKLDTNGANPGIIKKLISEKLVDYIAMDIKGAPDKLRKICGVKPDLDKIKESIKLIKKSGLPHEFRTTLVPGLHEPDDIKKMGRLIKGAEKWFLQEFKSDIDLVSKKLMGADSFSDEAFKEMVVVGGKYVWECRGR